MLATIIISAVIAAVVIAIVVKMVTDKRKGKHSCGCGCADCPNAGMCSHK